MQQQAVLNHKQAHSQMQLHEPDSRIIMCGRGKNFSRLAARGDDVDITENTTLGQLFKYTGKNDSDIAEWDLKFESSWELGLNLTSCMPLSWAKKQSKPVVQTFETTNALQTVVCLLRGCTNDQIGE